MDAEDRALRLCDGDEYAMLHVSQVEAAIEAAEREAREEERAACASLVRSLLPCSQMTTELISRQGAVQAIEARGEENQGA